MYSKISGLNVTTFEYILFTVSVNQSHMRKSKSDSILFNGVARYPA